MKTQWMVACKNADFEAIATKFNIDKVLARIIRNRGMVSEKEIGDFLNADMSDLHDPLQMKGMSPACEYIRNSIAEGQKIRIIGDYDVDGICATFILLKGLKKLGADVDTVIPHRIRDGYGLNDQLIIDASNDGIDLIITCDNGIAASSQVELAESLGIKVIVTDHHEVPYDEIEGTKRYIIPNAVSVIDPKQADCPYPFKGICGAFVAFKLVSVLLSDENLMEELIPFAAMATVCDVMELLDENRIIVKEGLKRMAEPINPGLRALVTSTGLNDKDISAFHFGFVLGPTINATGRLDTARRAVELFSCESFSEACLIATELKQLNDERKKLTEDGANEAYNLIDSSEMVEDKVLVVYLPNCHESIAGIIAGRVKERYYRPSIVLTDAEEGIKGSGRSIEGYDMYAELTKVKDLFVKYGGHTMAAGLSLDSVQKVDVLRKRLNENQKMSADTLTRKIHIDVPMPLSYISFGLVKSFDRLEPCGTSNPRPLFATKKLSLISYVKKGKTKLIGKLKFVDEIGKAYEMVYFEDTQNLDDFLLESYGEERFGRLTLKGCETGEILMNVVYSLGINTYNNSSSVQIVLKHFDVYKG